MEIYLGSIFNIEKNIPYALNTQVRITDKTMGILLPEVFMPIAEKTVVCKDIFKWTYNNCYKIMEKLQDRDINFKYFVITCPLKVLTDTALIDSFIENTKEHSKFTFSITPDVLLSSAKIIKINLEKLRASGSKILLLNFGCEGFPTSKIVNAPVDIVAFDSFLSSFMVGDVKQKLYLKGITTILKSININILINNIKNEAEFNIAKEYCDLVSGKYFGNYKKDRYIRK